MRFLITQGKLKDLKNRFYYKISDAVYCVDSCIPELQPLLLDKSKLIKKPFTSVVNFINNDESSIYHQDAKVGEKIYDLKVKTDKNKGYSLTADKHSFNITQKSIVTPIDCDPIILLGPALILNLAMNGVFCLHASACILNNNVFVFLAQSETGKSTIARYIGETKNAQRIADDIVPIKFINDQLTLLPNFPQLKLQPNQQYNSVAIRLKTHLMFVTKDENKKVKLTNLNTVNALKKLISHSIATRLLNQQHLKNHFKFCQKVVASSKCYQVSYQHKSNSLNELLEQLNEL